MVDAVYRVAGEFADVLLVANRAIDPAEVEESWLAVSRPRLDGGHQAPRPEDSTVLGALCAKSAGELACVR